MAIAKRNLILFQSVNSDVDLYNELTFHQWNVQVAHNIREAINLFDKYKFIVGLCLIDNCSDEKYIDQIKELFSISYNTNWIMGLPKEYKPDTFNITVESKLISQYCYDYLVFPVNTERLLFTLGHAYGMAEILPSRCKQFSDFPNIYGIIGKNPVMENIFKLISKLWQEDCSILIQGETGTGKEMIANAIHNHSCRAKKPLIAINCGAFPKDLIQAELFGYEKGAFTGAMQRRIGRIESAQGGTLFLDEIGDLPLEQQVNLLRFLEERTISRIGGHEKIPIDVRIIAATHVDLKAAVREGKFREDLYYRLRVLTITMPPLREREQDIELLAHYFFNRFSANQRYKSKGFSPEALYLLRNHDWPGNIRELMNCIRQAIIMSDNRLLTPADLGLERRSKGRTLKSLEEARAHAERESIINCLHYTNFNMSRTAEILEISRVSLYRLIDKYQLKVTPPV